MILSVLLNSSKRLSLVAEILYIIDLGFSYLHPNMMLVLWAMCLISAVLEPNNRELSSFWFQVSY